jgi:hypothetical protein
VYAFDGIVPDVDRADPKGQYFRELSSAPFDCAIVVDVLPRWSLSRYDTVPVL